MTQITGKLLKRLQIQKEVSPFYIGKQIQPITYMFSETITSPQIRVLEGFPGGAVVENLPANAGDTGSSPGLGRSHMPRSS